MTSEMKNLAQNTYEQALSKEEVMMFEALADKEAIHNAFGELLSQYRSGILDTRNEFVGHLCAKYRIENPREVQYDLIRQKLVSVYHPGVKAHKIEQRGYAFKELAQALFFDCVKKLGEVLKK
jgi:hypothetical protein